MVLVQARFVRVALVVSLFGLSGLVEARDFRRDMLPNARLLPGSRLRGCIACHIDDNPKESENNTERNAFGMDVEQLVTEDGFEPFWGAALAAMDSDGDGYTNGEELQDPDGLELHRIFQVAFDENFPIEVAEEIDTDELEIGDETLLSNPGLADSVPPGGNNNPTPTVTNSPLPEATATPTDLPAPTDTPAPEPTATATIDMMDGLDKDNNQFLDSHDLLAHLKDGLDRTQWLMFTTRWKQPI